MKLRNILVGVCFLFSTSVWSQPREALPELGEFVIKDVTKFYPRNNYYDQMQDCSDNGTSSVSPVSGTGGASGGGVLFPPSAGGATGNPDPGVIVILPPGAVDTGTGYPGGSLYPGGVNFPGTGLVIIDQIVNLGNFVWQMVQNSKPNMRISTYRAHGLPKGVTCWTELEEWKIPKSKVFTVDQKSKFGQTLAKFTFRISFVYGGNYNGTGRYLANVTVSPVDVQVGWGVDFGSEVHIPAVFNMGTKVNPLAAMQIFVYWNLGSATKMQQKSQLFHVTGEGVIQAAAQ